jgi:hypothetical protein
VILRLTRSSRFSGTQLSATPELFLTVNMHYRVLGTPNENTWPGVSQFPDYKTTFPQWQATDLKRVITTMDETGIDLLNVSGCSFSVIILVLTDVGAL